MSGIQLFSRQVFCELRKEFQQYRGLWMTPVVLTLAPVAIMVIMEIVHTFWALAAGHPITVHATNFSINAQRIGFNPNEDNSLEGKAAAIAVIGLLSTGIAPVAGLIVTGLYASSAFLRDRRDQTILFWKSLPVPESAVVLARILFCSVGIPLTTWCAQWALIALSSGIIIGDFIIPNSIIGLRFASWENLFAFLWFCLTAVPLGGMLLILWWFPIWALLLLWSGIMRSYPLLWATVVIGILTTIEAIENGTYRGITAIWKHVKSQWIGEYVLAHLWQGLHHIPSFSAQGEQLPPQMKANISFWSALQAHSGETLAGFAIGVVALVAAGYLRRRAGPL
ncbi:hypothetical protein [Neokomagataea anthophila]|uniref:ABC transporter permease n=1 Tax=Neokomagataea anthophila TaxID=2826925 RepID=A0ABS5E6K4_9PROT|nr:hypothetical protein [Neokomagataea anthophila]MBR0559540.1 hypothetical protein [Neokomagataea anthophila]